MIIVLVVASSYADLPPIGDANCKEESCNSVNCESGIDCSFGKLMGDPKSICGCCKLCLNYIGENERCSPNMNNQECGPGLYCEASQNSNSDFKCVKSQ
uniref:IGFBP N-terminal domain-containing protein n=1 Tax=Daphnia galeata TaxID=27404 RepID=A0A8J2RQZ2_9CRUS|nr:unnamed protein product [Daphnia galeata]